VLRDREPFRQSTGQLLKIYLLTSAILLWFNESGHFSKMPRDTEIKDERLQLRVRARYSKDMAALEALGFRLLAFVLETRAPFSALAYLPVLRLLRRAKEVLVFPFPLRLASAIVLLFHADPSTIACCIGLGVKFYTKFSDHSLLISSTLLSHAALQASGLQTPGSQIVRTPPGRTLEEAWSLHTGQVHQMKLGERAMSIAGSFADYVEISEREEAELRHAASALP
jgi:hypothetical protein